VKKFWTKEYKVAAPQRENVTAERTFAFYILKNNYTSLEHNNESAYYC